VRWDGSDDAIAELRQDVAVHAGTESAAFVFDLLGPVAYRFRQSDGSLALPVKLAGGFHLLGEVTTAEDSTIRSCIGRLGPVLTEMWRIPTILVPPLPRFVFGGCCRAKNHAIGSGTETAAKNMIGRIAHLRKVAKTELQKIGGENWWLADMVSGLGGVENLAELKSMMAPDNVHFTGVGYSKIGAEIFEGISKVKTKVERAAPKPKVYYWHGFTSTNGATGLRRDHSGTNRGGSGGRGSRQGQDRGRRGPSSGRAGDGGGGHRFNPYAR